MATEARFPIRLDSNAAQVGAEGANALEQMRQKILGSQDAVRSYSDSLKKLRGTSDEVVAAKKMLKDRLDAERNAISQNTLAILKEGTSYDKLSTQHRKMTAELAKGTAGAKGNSEALGKSIDAIGGPVADVKNKVSGMGDALAGADTAMGALAIGAAAAVVGVLAIAGAIGALAAKLGEFILTNGNMLRTQKLSREAFLGSAEDAENLGDQIDLLGKKVPATREQLNGMAKELALAGVQGSILVDTLEAQAEVSGALGDGAGKIIAGLSESSRVTNRFGLDMTRLNTSLQGTGIASEDVAQALAKNTHTSVAEARTALMQHQVTWASGMQAMKDAVDKKFGKNNLAKMLDLDVMRAKFSDTLASLTSSVDLTPLLEGLKTIAGLFDTTTETGADLKLLVTQFGTDAVSAFKAATPAIKGFIEEMVGKALDLEIEYLSLKLQFQDTFGPDVLDDLDVFKTGVAAADGAVAALSFSLKALEASVYPMKLLGQGIAAALKATGGDKALVSAAKGAAGPSQLPGHASGGVVTGIGGGLASVAPAPGEGLASVGRGERILSADEARVASAMGSSGGGGSSGALPPVVVHVAYQAAPGGGEQAGQKIPDDFIVAVRRAVTEALRTSLVSRGVPC